MTSIDLTEPARVQYGDYLGTIAGDVTDLKELEHFFGVAERVLAVDLTIYGGHQRLIAYGVPSGTTYHDLEALVASGEPIRVTVVKEIDLPIPGHGDSNPPAPVHLPVQSATELLVHGFKRFHLRMLTRALPEGFKMVVEDQP